MLAAILIGGTYYFGEPKYEEWKDGRNDRALKLQDRITLADRISLEER